MWRDTHPNNRRPRLNNSKHLFKCTLYLFQNNSVVVLQPPILHVISHLSYACYMSHISQCPPLIAPLYIGDRIMKAVFLQLHPASCHFLPQWWAFYQQPSYNATTLIADLRGVWVDVKKPGLGTYTCIYICVCVYIYIYRERERGEWESGGGNVATRNAVTWK